MQVACRQNRTAARLILVNENVACAATVNCLQHTDCLNHSSDNCCESALQSNSETLPHSEIHPGISSNCKRPRFCSTLVRKTNERSRGPAATAYRFQMNAMPFCPSCPLRGGATRSKLLPSLPSRCRNRPLPAIPEKAILGRRMTRNDERTRPNVPERVRTRKKIGATKRD